MLKILKHAWTAARALGIVEILLKTFQKQRLCPADMDFIVGGLKTVMNLQEDPIDDLRCDTHRNTFFPSISPG